jgi:hypothetical protein
MRRSIEMLTTVRLVIIFCLHIGVAVKLKVAGLSQAQPLFDQLARPKLVQSIRLLNVNIQQGALKRKAYSNYVSQVNSYNTGLIPKFVEF